MTELRAFHNDPTIKEKYLARVKAHQEADEIIKDVYWENGKGCAVGCTIEGNDHKKYETKLGIPIEIALLEDKLFEGLPNEEAKTFPLRFLKAIPVGADLSLVIPKFLYWLLTDNKHGVINFIENKTIVTNVTDLLKLKINRQNITKEQWADAAYIAAAIIRTYAVYAAASYVADARTSAYAYSLASSSTPTPANAREEYILLQSEKLLELLKEAK